MIKAHISCSNNIGIPYDIRMLLRIHSITVNKDTFKQRKSCSGWLYGVKQLTYFKAMFKPFIFFHFADKVVNNYKKKLISEKDLT